MARASLADYLQEVLKRGNEPGYIQHHGYRTVRWTYRQVAEAVFRFARELDAREIHKGDRTELRGRTIKPIDDFCTCALVDVSGCPGRDRPGNSRRTCRSQMLHLCGFIEYTDAFDMNLLHLFSGFRAAWTSSKCSTVAAAVNFTASWSSDIASSAG
jgi:hypothetical protein